MQKTADHDFVSLQEPHCCPARWRAVASWSVLSCLFAGAFESRDATCVLRQGTNGKGKKGGKNSNVDDDIYGDFGDDSSYDDEELGELSDDINFDDSYDR